MEQSGFETSYSAPSRDLGRVLLPGYMADGYLYTDAKRYRRRSVVVGKVHHLDHRCGSGPPFMPHPVYTCRPKGKCASPFHNLYSDTFSVGPRRS